MHIIIKGSPFVRGNRNDDSWQRQKDILHRRRKELEGDLKQTIFSKDKMMANDCHTETEEEQRANEYDKWKRTKDVSGKSNEGKLKEWLEINREFKKHNEEGKPISADDLRQKKEVKYN